MRVISVIAKIKQHSHHQTHLHAMKVVTILIPSFHGLFLERLGAWSPICDGHTQKNACIFRLSLY